MTAGSTRHDPFGFPETIWDLVIEARESEAARNQLLTLYYRPVLAFFRALTKNSGAAEELRQSFFEVELTRLSGEAARGVVRRADPQKGRFRDFLKQSLRHHWLSSLRSDKRFFEPVPDDEDWGPRVTGAERAFARSWVEQVVAIALRKVEKICQERGQDQHFAIFMAHYFPSSEVDPSWESLAPQFGQKDGKTARNRASTVEAHMQKALGELLLRERPDANLPEEVRDVLSILGDDDA